jgi:hypothetical protein
MVCLDHNISDIKNQEEHVHLHSPLFYGDKNLHTYSKQYQQKKPSTPKIHNQESIYLLLPLNLCWENYTFGLLF